MNVRAKSWNEWRIYGQYECAAHTEIAHWKLAMEMGKRTEKKRGFEAKINVDTTSASCM